ncbi:MAG: hypothetical protein ABSH38_19840 [Verrucomicrobiota bacterium]
MSANAARSARRGVRLRLVLTGTTALLTAMTAGWFAPEASAGETPPAAELTNKTGSFEYSQPGGRHGADAGLPFPMFVGDQIWTRTNSTAVVLMRNVGASIKLRELSSLKILPPENDSSPIINLLKGALYFFSRERSSAPSFRTPFATGAHIGTEFVLVVEEERTLLQALDGVAKLSNEQGALELRRGEVGEARKGRPPVKIRLEATNIVQWWLYYPGALDVDEVSFSPSERAAYAQSIDAYRLGDLAGALAALPGSPSSIEPMTDSGRVFLSALYLAAGGVDKAERLLDKADAASSTAASLRWVIAAAQGNLERPPAVGRSASEWLGLSYYYEARHELKKALEAAYWSLGTETNFGFGLERVAELEFSFGHVGKAKAALNESLRAAPRNAQAHALMGFLDSAENSVKQARSEFEQAIRLDPNLGNAWLGRGLVKIRSGEAAAGRMDLQMAAILEPNRSLFRSYLGKAFGDAGKDAPAAAELQRAEGLDAKDPTPWLYSALQEQQQNRVNPAIYDLQAAQTNNDNRMVFRSQLLLDEDRAVTGANLASVYRDAGMTGVSVREAARAVTDDYANDSAHLFLADSFYDLRDPTQFNLRYETVWFNELLLANVLAPVGGGRLSQEVSQQEYSKLFEADGLHLASSTDARSDGMFHQLASQYGTFGNTSYALDLDYHHNNGVRVNNALDDIEWNTTMKQQITPRDTAMLLVQYQDYHSGDNFQYYYQTNARSFYKFDEQQQPILVGAWHHEWGPGIHTVLLVGRLVDDQQFSDRAAPQLLFAERQSGAIYGANAVPFDVSYNEDFEIYSAELNQICQWDRVTLLAGGRYQSGEFHTQDRFSNPPSGLSPLFTQSGAYSGDTTGLFQRVTGYSYLTVEPLDHLWLTGGVAAEDEKFPYYFRNPPITSGEDTRSQVGPKAALVWSPLPEATVRGIYTRSLGGVSLDESYRLEPTELAGFPQAFRSLISESIVGSQSAPTFDTLGAALDLKLGRRTYAGIQFEQLGSDVNQGIGDLALPDGRVPAIVSSTEELLHYTENTFSVSLNQLLGDDLVLGAAYKITQSDLHDELPDIPVSALATANQTLKASLQEVDSYVLFNHPSGFFARVEAHWYGQHNSGWTPAEPDVSFVQENLFAGCRFEHRRAELQLGLLNLSGGGYNLNPLTVYQELPRKRVFEARLNFIF